MRLFHPGNPARSDRHARVWAVTELLRTLVDFSAALMFVIGSILFFFASTQIPATWLFLIGSIFFGLKPTIRLGRELKFIALDREDALRRMEEK
ncbi:N-acetyl-gamma-glutamyl-phosphate reductase [Thioclava sp. BHET1]|nr:N-acetyl-gamma-glutamyl-phosphate reductase [Thioclava sp. BHET1]